MAAVAGEDCVLGVVIAARRGLQVLFDRFWLPGCVPCVCELSVGGNINASA